MGREVLALCEAGYRGAECVGGVDAFAKGGETYIVYKDFSDVPEAAIDCIVDFSHHTLTPALLDFAIARNIPTVLCTTAHTPEEKAKIALAAEKIPLFFSANMSLGVALLVELAKKTAAAMPEADIEIIEKHHNRKLDAPSGTALMLANAIKTVRETAKYVFGRHGQSKREREIRKNQKVIDIKEVRLSATIEDHDVEVKFKAATKFLKDGDKVKVSIRFRGRQISHSEIGLEVMKDFAERLQDIAVIERRPLTEGRNMTMVLAPKESK